MKILADLIKIESLSGKEENLAMFLIEHLTSLGFQPFLQDGNVILQIKGENEENAVIFNAHMDTVEPGDLSSWKYPPVGKNAGVFMDKKLYGLGASDDKAGIASLLILAKQFVNKLPKTDVWITFVTKEEVDGSGTKNFIKWFTSEGWLKKYKKISAVICEPTNLEEIKIGHRGNIFASVTLHGDGGHGSRPSAIKINAIKNMYLVIGEIEKIATKWATKYQHPVLGQPTLAITTISAGNPLSPNKFADSCSITLDIRTTPKLHDSAISLLKKALKKFEAKIDTLYEPAFFGNTDPNAEIVIKAKQITGTKITINIGSNDLCFFTEAKIPGIIFGPGNNTSMHKANEYCEIKKIEEAASIYSQLV